MSDFGPPLAYFQMKTADLMRAYSKASKAARKFEDKHGIIGNNVARRHAGDYSLVLRQRGVIASEIA